MVSLQQVLLSQRFSLLVVIKNMIEPAIMGSIPECGTVTEYLDKIKSQFIGSSKTYATQLIKQLVTERYLGNGGIREHILRMSNLASKLKPMDLALKDEFLIHLIFAFLPKSLILLLSTTTYSPRSGTWRGSWLCVCKRRRE